MLMSFWRKEHDPQKKIVIYYCDKHKFQTSNPLEVEEHERIHEEEGGILWGT